MTRRIKHYRGCHRLIWAGAMLLVACAVFQPAKAQAQDWTASAPNIYFTGGNVGVGTSTPQNILHIVTSGTSVPFRMESTNASGYSGFNFFNEGGTLASSFVHANSTASALPNSTWLGSRNAEPLIFVTNGTGERMRIDSTGKVGIGTSAPTTKLDVNGTINATALTVGGSPVTSSQWTTSGANINYSSGNVGIGISNPASKLDILGNLNASGTITGGNIIAKYQDVAEWVPSAQVLSAGTVVTLDPTASNQVMASSQAYDTRVAGVISARPGLVLGENGAGKVLVATTGRVKVRVDATQTPIQVGDLLVTGDKEGVAMKSLPINIGGVQIHRPGTLIGKALEPLEKGSGEILVLLSLQ